MKKLGLALIAILCCVLTACEGSASSSDSGSNEQDGYASSGNVVANRDYFEWSPTDETMIIGYTDEGLKQTELVIPEECTSVQGLSDNTTVQHISFENDDTIIQTDTFGDCTSLESIELPGNLQVIDQSVFYGCTSLKEITIPDSVVEIESNAFNGCESLSSVTLGSALSTIGRKAFHGCNSLESIVIPDSVVTIEKSAFENCSVGCFIWCGY